MKAVNGFFLIAVLGLLAAACGDSGNEFVLKGAVDGLDGQKIFLVLGEDRVDTALIEKGRFEFRDTIEHALMAGVVVGEVSYENMNHVAQFFIDAGEMELSLPTDSFPGYTLKGSKAEDENQELLKAVKPLEEKIRSIHKQIQSAGKENAAPLEKEYDACMEQIQALQKKFVMEHPASYVAAFYTIYLTGSLPYEDLKAIYENFTPELQKSKELESLRQEVETLAKVQPGMPAPNIAKEDINGKPFDMQTLKGNVVLLDFWASWCKPCRASNPHVKALYEKYHAKGFEVVMVSDDDSNPDAWHKAVEEDQTGAFHHVLRGLKQAPEGSANPFDDSEDVSKAYAIHYLPTKYLIDKDLNIVGKFTDEELDAKLKEIFGE